MVTLIRGTIKWNLFDPAHHPLELNVIHLQQSPLNNTAALGPGAA